MEPIVSVIVLTYNNIQYFHQCIKSILTQNYKNIELIISDDCSNNFDIKIIEEYIKKHKKSNIIKYNIIKHNKNLGTVKNFNYAIKNSIGEYIIPLAIDDCFYDENVISSVVKKFQTTNAYIITGYRDVYDENLNKMMFRLPIHKKIKLFNNMDKLYKSICKNNFISGSCTSYSKKLFLEDGYFDEEYRLLEDYPKYLKSIRNGKKIYFIDISIIKYRIGGISGKKGINPILKGDYALLTKRDILPYPDKIGVFLYRTRMFEWCKSKQDTNIIVLCLKYIDVVVYKLLVKFKNIIKIGDVKYEI